MNSSGEELGEEREMKSMEWKGKRGDGWSFWRARRWEGLSGRRGLGDGGVCSCLGM